MSLVIKKIPAPITIVSTIHPIAYTMGVIISIIAISIHTRKIATNIAPIPIHIFLFIYLFTFC